MIADVEALAKEIVAGSRRSLARAITLLESAKPEDRAAAEALLARLAPAAGRAVRLGISGAPGVGKSTLIEALGACVLGAGHRLAILAVDPSSPITGGSILGDRVRMEELSRQARVFIRPTPSGTALGGVARRTREAMLACEAAGHDVVFVETVGVGQGETMVASMVDLLLVLHLPNSGDEIQGMKKGLLELADLVAVTKADDSRRNDAAVAQLQLEQALALTAAPAGPPPVLTVSAMERGGVERLWTSVEALVAARRRDGRFEARRVDQAVQWFQAELGDRLTERLRARPDLNALLLDAERAVRAGKTPASVAAGRIIDAVIPPHSPR